MNPALNNLKNTSMKRLFIIFIFIFSFCKIEAQQYYTVDKSKISLTLLGASHLASLPLKCLDKEFPFKSWIVMTDSTFITRPKNLHPAFCGCYDWHSCVHGHWLLVSLLKQYPNIAEADSIRLKLRRHLSAANMKTELALFTGENKTFERPYGWAWLLQLQNELLTWNTPTGKELSANVDSLARFLSIQWVTYLNTLQYPVREPEHYNLAFGMGLAFDYAITAKDTALEHAVRKAAKRFYLHDVNCPCAYEPGGFDFLSPCLEEADLMQRILSKEQFNHWLKNFMPEIYTHPAALFQVGIVSDPKDGKMVHLYGLNFSRAWCLYDIADKMPKENAKAVKTLARRHIEYSFSHVVSGAYEGDHWLATFAVFALRHGAF